MTNQVKAAPANRRNQALGATGQVAGVIGIVVCFALIVGVLLGRGWLVGRVNDVAARVDTGLVKGETLIDNASARVSEVSGRVGGVTDAANALASNPNPAPALTEALLGQLSGVSDRYLALRASYADARETAVATLDRLNTLDQMVPFFSIPQGPVDALSSLDARFQALDASIMEVLNAPGAGAVNAVAAAVAQKTATIETALANVTTKLADGKTRLETLRGNVAAKADQVDWVITLVSLVLILAFLYFAFLHWLLFRTGRALRRGAAAQVLAPAVAAAAPAAAIPAPAAPSAAIPAPAAPSAAVPAEVAAPVAPAEVVPPAEDVPTEVIPTEPSRAEAPPADGPKD